jgi:hypothetical protein
LVVDQVKLVNGPASHVISSENTPVNDDDAGHLADVRMIPIERPQHAKHDGGGAATKRSPELAPASTTAAVNSDDKEIVR